MNSISTIIPTRNYGQFLSQAVDSALEQTLAPGEVIVVDDGSTDNTEQVVAKFGDSVMYFKQENMGVCAARNRGVAESSGDLIAFLDADDIWEPTKLEKQAALFEADDELGLVHSGMREFDSATGETLKVHIEGKEGWVARDVALWEEPTIIGPGGTIMVSRKVFDDVGGFDTNLKNGEDWEFCFRVARKYKVGFVAEPLVNYRYHGKNAHMNIREMERSTLLAWAKVFDGSDPEIEALRSRSYGNLHKVLAGSYLKQRDYGGFTRNLVKSLWFRPTYLSYYLFLLFRDRNRWTQNS